MNKRICLDSAERRIQTAINMMLELKDNGYSCYSNDKILELLINYGANIQTWRQSKQSECLTLGHIHNPPFKKEYRPVDKF